MMNFPAQLADSHATFAEHRKMLADFRNVSSLGKSFFDSLESLRRSAEADSDEATANATWLIGSIGKAQEHFRSVVQYAKAKDYYKAWCELERCEIALRSLAPHYAEDGQNFGIAHMLAHVPASQDLYPYRLFLSPAYVVEESECSICGVPFKVRGGCSHLVGKIYYGQMCCRVVTQARLIEVSLVTNPVQKYSVTFIDGRDYNYDAVDLVTRRLTGPWHQWAYTYTR